MSDRLAIRDTLAKAQGLKQAHYSKKVHWYRRTLLEGAHPLPDPFTNPTDLLALLEWARNQAWFVTMRVGNIGVAVDHGFPKKECAVQGSFQEALPLAIYQVLQEVKA